MKLKKIEMKGFKSFCDRTVIEFKKGITCIVGPNGSGKSNITDAIRWVLGEQSTKTLRAKKMSDVIFNGTKYKQRQNYAEVILYFSSNDNENINIKRIMYRNGESNYYLNNKIVRLKDVKSIIMDTGVGISGYSIIAQGNIEDILSDSKFDRRKIFEEASQISYLNYKKQESEKKLEKVKLNMERINDIIFTINETLPDLKTQRNKAIEYKELKEKEQKADLYYNYKDYTKYKLELEQTEISINKTKKELNLLNGEVEKLIDEKEKINKDLTQNYSIIQTSNEIEKEESTSREKLNSQIKIKEERINSLNTSFEISKSKIQTIKSVLDESIEKNKEADSQLENVNSIRKEIESKLDSLNRENDILKQKIYKHGISKEEKDELSNELFIKIETAKDKINLLITNIDTNNENIKKIKNEEKSIKEKISINQKGLIDLENESKIIQNNINKLENEINLKDKEFSENKNKKLNHDKFINELLKDYTKTKTEMELIKNHSNSPLSHNKVLEFVKKNFKDQYLGSIAELMSVDKVYEEAINTALFSSINNIVVKNIKVLKDIIDSINQKELGRATFIPLDNLNKIEILKINDKLISTRAIDIIEYDKKYEKVFSLLLNNTYISNNLADAIEYSKKSNKRIRIITLKGELVNIKGKVVGGKSKNTNNVFSLLNRIKNLNKKTKELNDKIKNEEKNQILINLDLDEQRNKLNKNKELLIFLNKEKINTKLKYDKQKTQNDILVKTLDEINNNVIEINDKAKSEKNELDILKNSINDYHLALNDIKNDSEESMDKESENLETLEKEIINLKIENAKNEQNYNSIKNLYTERATFILNKKNEIEIERLNNKNIFENIEKYKDEIELDKTNHYKLTEKIKSLRNKVSELNNQNNKSNNLIKELDSKVNSFNEKLNKNKDCLNDSQILKAKNEQRIDIILADIWDKYNLSMLEVKDIIGDSIDISKTELKRIAQKLRSLEPVNLQAPEEYEKQKAKFDFLNDQNNDLVKSKSDITNTILNLEDKMKKDFLTTFEEIKANFSTVFTKLFNGGVGNIELNEPDNLLETDINIFASPPGKKLKHLNLLSGGEKALTAIALLFSVLKAKPAPFYILDEIEAALDDINIFRFGNFLTEFQKSSQFILITHRKGTMEFAQALYGVSMEEKGISKMVSLELEN